MVKDTIKQAINMALFTAAKRKRKDSKRECRSGAASKSDICAFIIRGVVSAVVDMEVLNFLIESKLPIRSPRKGMIPHTILKEREGKGREGKGRRRKGKERKGKEEVVEAKKRRKKK